MGGGLKGVEAEGRLSEEKSFLNFTSGRTHIKSVFFNLTGDCSCDHLI